MSGNEKRCEKRIVHAAPVETKIQSCPGFHELEGAIFPGTTCDLSENGVRLHISQFLPDNTFLEMEVTLGEQRYLLSGRVVWSQMIDETTVYMGILLTADNESRMWSWKKQLSTLVGPEC